jgi:hypothetical protein
MRVSSQGFFRLILSIALAYPLTGVVYWTFGMLKGLPDTLKTPAVDLFLLFFWIIAIPTYGGFVPANEGDVGPRTNMYPWIIPTAAALFFLFSQGWKWFRRNRNSN